MSKLYDKYSQLKMSDPNTYYLFRSGLFYIFLADDAIKISKTLKLKCSNLNQDVLKCGFPVDSLSKYQAIFRNLNIQVKLIEEHEEKILCSQSNGLSNCLNKVRDLRLEETTPMQAFQILSDLKEALISE